MSESEVTDRLRYSRDVSTRQAMDKGISPSDYRTHIQYYECKVQLEKEED